MNLKDSHKPFSLRFKPAPEETEQEKRHRVTSLDPATVVTTDTLTVTAANNKSNGRAGNVPISERIIIIIN